MKLIRGIQNLKNRLTHCVVTIGNFDGVHLGHQSLIQALHKKRAELNVPSVVITFEPQPNEFFAKNQPVSRLTRFREKRFYLSRLGVDYLLCIRFDSHFANQPAEAFVKEVLINKMGMQAIIVGDDFRFGAKRAGNFSLLKKLGEAYHYTAEQITTLTIDNERVSSTRVRQALAKGDFVLAKKLLGHPYELIGKVAHGDKRGREMGYPTANIYLHRKQVPMTGIFAVKVRDIDDRVYYGAAYIGIRSVFNGDRVILEVHIFDFDQMIYGKNLRIEPLAKIRDDAHFDTVNDLVTQIRNDIHAVKSYFNQSQLIKN